MKASFQRIVSVIFVMLLLAACTASLAPRYADWAAPSAFTEKQVFTAALQAGSAIGYQPVISDRETGTASFRRSLGATALGGEGILTLTANISKTGQVVNVRTTATYNGLAVAGIHEEEINKFYTELFNQLGITAETQRQYNIVTQ